MKKWYYKQKSGDQAIAVSKHDDLLNLEVKRIIKPDTLISCDGKNWLAAKEDESFAFSFPHVHYGEDSSFFTGLHVTNVEEGEDGTRRYTIKREYFVGTKSKSKFGRYFATPDEIDKAGMKPGGVLFTIRNQPVRAKLTSWCVKPESHDGSDMFKTKHMSGIESTFVTEWTKVK